MGFVRHFLVIRVVTTYYHHHGILYDILETTLVYSFMDHDVRTHYLASNIIIATYTY